MRDMVEKHRARFGQLRRHRRSPVRSNRPAIKPGRKVFAKHPIGALGDRIHSGDFPM